MDRLEFDIDKLRETKEKCDSLADEIGEMRDSLFDYLEELKRDWNTDAGRKFFAEQDADWSAQVDNYIKVTKAIGELLDTAITKYQGVIDEAKKIQL